MACKTGMLVSEQAHVRMSVFHNAPVLVVHTVYEQTHARMLSYDPDVAYVIPRLRNPPLM